MSFNGYNVQGDSSGSSLITPQLIAALADAGYSLVPSPHGALRRYLNEATPTEASGNATSSGCPSAHELGELVRPTIYPYFHFHILIEHEYLSRVRLRQRRQLQLLLLYYALYQLH